MHKWIALFILALNSFFSSLNRTHSNQNKFQPQDLTSVTDPYLPAISIGSVRLLGTIAGTIMLRRVGKRTLIVSTAAVMAVAIAVLGINIQFQEYFVSWEK